MQCSRTEAPFLPHLNLASLETPQSPKHSLPQNLHSKLTLHVTSWSTSFIFWLPILLLFTLVPLLIRGHLAAPHWDLHRGITSVGHRTGRSSASHLKEAEGLTLAKGRRQPTIARDGESTVTATHEEHRLRVEKPLPKAPKPPGATAHTACCSSRRDVRDAAREMLSFLEAKHTLHSQADSGPCSAPGARDQGSCGVQYRKDAPSHPALRSASSGRGAGGRSTAGGDGLEWHPGRCSGSWHSQRKNGAATGQRGGAQRHLEERGPQRVRGEGRAQLGTENLWGCGDGAAGAAGWGSPTPRTEVQPLPQRGGREYPTRNPQSRWGREPPSRPHTAAAQGQTPRGEASPL